MDEISVSSGPSYPPSLPFLSLSKTGFSVLKVKREEWQVVVVKQKTVEKLAIKSLGKSAS